ncbi:glycosyltransferase family A protein [Mesorhizobium sp. CA16]|uniref:glycosyltransferase family A protein n=1 Tax=Mesorhizobium sp. CA16 TaxID=588496 RepID=UPI001CC93707|nr:glycosyltransferase family A protein [Mesorhizobium sp. CA16]MBZ9914294.1 glycosyltransferase family 2 protein [Mesorhizobium sp. CA16]
MAEHPTYSIVLEMENAKSIDWDEIGLGLKALAREIAQASATGFPKPKVIISHGGLETDAVSLRSSIGAEAPQLEQVADLAFAAFPGGRYYDLKNNGIPSCEGSVLVFLDSDTVPERNWLSTLLKPFVDQPETICVNGHTYLSYDDFFSRTFALIWFFPMAEGDERFASKRALNQQHCLSARLDIQSPISSPQRLQGLVHVADAPALERRPQDSQRGRTRSPLFAAGLGVLLLARAGNRQGRRSKIRRASCTWQGSAYRQILHALGDYVLAHDPASDRPCAADRHALLANPVCCHCRTGVLYTGVFRPFQPGGRPCP